MSVAGGGGKKKHKFLRSLTCDRIPLTPQLSPGQVTKVDNKVGSDMQGVTKKGGDVEFFCHGYPAPGYRWREES